jgi:hypothetical protein
LPTSTFRRARASNWQGRRLQSAIEPVIAIERFGMVEQAVRAAATFDLMMIDAPPNSTAGTLRIARTADIVSGAYTACVKDRRHAWQLYKSIASDNEKLVVAARVELRGKNLACWCPLPASPYEPDECHAAVLLEIANSEETLP